MQDIVEFIEKLFVAAQWPARWYCGQWSPFHGWLYIISSVAIAGAYFTIPLILFLVLKKRREDLPFIKIFWLFILFILACGTTHFVDALMFWYPAYRVSALVLLFTAIISWVTVFALMKILPQALNLKTPAQLESIIRLRTQELENSNAHLKKLHTDLDNFIYSASHDLKSPINNIEGLFNIIKDELKQGIVPSESHLERIEHSIDKVRNTILKLTDAIKVQASPYDDLNVLRFEDLIHEVLLENENAVQEKDVMVIKDLKVKDISYSYEGLKSILFNLITNAIKYSSPQRRPIIKISTEMVAEKIVLTVEDNGLGIDMGLNRDKLFSLFKRFHTHVDGAGIGLYIVKKLIEDKGGRIDVESVENQGTIFKVTF